ncbi:Os03g0441301 [Oryza sativa Japonica Group]|uniref:Os03g0441301 protein n=1 Tax=Oryza sativa subsp. japonica TaxID=39947 RepID=A0A0P0VZ69_ORYSJ|nr:Os03g0441301 [Oryza sativa Japonica Group]
MDSWCMSPRRRHNCVDQEEARSGTAGEDLGTAARAEVAVAQWWWAAPVSLPLLFSPSHARLIRGIIVREKLKLMNNIFEMEESLKVAYQRMPTCYEWRLGKSHLESDIIAKQVFMSGTYAIFSRRRLHILMERGTVPRRNKGFALLAAFQRP